MSDPPPAEQDTNERYLEAALRWLRLRLEWFATAQRPPLGIVPPSEAAPAAQNVPEGGASWWRRRRSEPAGESPPPAQPALPAPQPASKEQVDEAAAAMRAAEEAEPRPALVELAERLGLSRFEVEVLLLCAALELDTRVPILCGRAQDNPSLTYPTFALALALFEAPTWEALSPERPLRYWRLIEIAQPPGQPLISSPLRVDERIVNYLRGLNELDDRLTSLLVPPEVWNPPPELPPSQQAVVERIVRRWSRSEPGPALPLVQLLGPDPDSKYLVAGRAAAELGCSLYRLPVENLPGQAAEIENLARLWQRESRLLPLALYLDAQELDGAGSEGAWPALRRFLARSFGALFLGLREVWPGSGRQQLALDVAHPTAVEQRAAWEARIGEAAPNTPALLAGQFNLNLAAIHRIADLALPDEGARRPPRLRVWDACLAETRPRLEALAQRLEAKATWDDLVLPEAETELLRRIAAQVWQRSTVYQTWGFGERMNRGFGITVLFAGPSGTGKTMAAEVLANHLRLHLYRIDLSAVVSKYIGETEKNLRKLFDAAEDGGALPFFDEADALFGKRSEVKDSHDRYANIEINYLLQRMEAYRGLAILATNMRSALDQAFLRRLRFIVSFPFPGLEQRREMWQKAFPAAMREQLGELDYERLARLPATGGMIHNIALNAAFAAAAGRDKVSMPLVLEAAGIEFRKLELPVPDAELVWEGPESAGARA